MRHARGFSLVELLLGLSILGVLLSAIAGFFRSENQAHLQQDLLVRMEQNLRVSMEMVKDDLRRSGFGAPTLTSTIPLASWVPSTWMASFNSNPLVTQGSGSAPDSISIASCTAKPVAYLNADRAMGATTLSLDVTAAAAGLDAANRRLIRVGDAEFAWVTGTGSPVTIDTDPLTSSNPGLSRPYFGDTVASTPDTPVCRVDIVTYAIETENGASRLVRNLNQGGGPAAIADEIVDLQIANPSGCAAPDCYEITLTARTEKNVPGRATRPTRTLVSRVARKN